MLSTPRELRDPRHTLALLKQIALQSALVVPLAAMPVLVQLLCQAQSKRHPTRRLTRALRLLTHICTHVKLLAGRIAVLVADGDAHATDVGVGRHQRAKGITRLSLTLVPRVEPAVHIEQVKEQLHARPPLRPLSLILQLREQPARHLEHDGLAVLQKHLNTRSAALEHRTGRPRKRSRVIQVDPEPSNRQLSQLLAKLEGIGPDGIDAALRNKPRRHHLSSRLRVSVLDVDVSLSVLGRSDARKEGADQHTPGRGLPVASSAHLLWLEHLQACITRHVRT